MRGYSYENSIATGLAATKPYRDATRDMKRQKRMCWKCQTEQPTKDGHIKTFAGGTMKFICKSCLDKKKEKVDDTREKS